MKTDSRYALVQRSLTGVALAGVLLGLWGGATPGSLSSGRSEPVIDAVTPDSAAEGTEVTLLGANFGPSVGALQGTSGVSFNGVWSTPRSWSDNSITVAVPPGAATGEVVVTVSGRQSAGVEFTVTGGGGTGPAIGTVSPGLGMEGTEVTIRGARFGSAAERGGVSFNGVWASAASWSEEEIRVRVPADATTGNVVVTANGVASDGVAFVVAESGWGEPAIESLSAASGPEGMVVTIEGENFGPSMGAYEGTSGVSFNGVWGEPSAWSETVIQVAVPAGAPSGLVTVTVGGEGSNGKGFVVERAGPVIEAVETVWGRDGARVEIRGRNFGPAMEAAQGWSGVSLEGEWGVPGYWSDREIHAAVPAGVSGGLVVVSSAGQESNGVPFSARRAKAMPPAPVVFASSVSPSAAARAAPTLKSLYPDRGPEGERVRIKGKNYGASRGTSTVTFNGTAVTNYVSWRDKKIVVEVPEGATTGDVVVTVGGVASPRVAFTVTAGPVPSVGSLDPDSGPEGTSVEITGTSFGAVQGTSTVTFNGVAATATSWSDTSIRAAVPMGARTGEVVVTVEGTPSDGVSFTVTPAIGSLSPDSGPEGASVEIAGTSFGAVQGTSTVTFNGTAATPTSWSDTSITVTVPEGAATGEVVVTVGGEASNGVSFTVTPAISELSPVAGPEGASVEITGTSFGAVQGMSTVTFNGTEAATADSWSDTSITVTVPAGATTGEVMVTVGGEASNGVSFTVGTDPVISGLNPDSGPVGTEVEIRGANFGASRGTSRVTFNGAEATPTNWSATSITATVPAEATTGPVVVTVNGEASNAVTFGVKPLISGLSRVSGPEGATVEIAGAGFGAVQGSSTVAFNGTGATPTSWSATSIMVTVPAGATTGQVVVTVDGTPSDGAAFSVTPAIGSLSPIAGPEGAAVEITGTSFGAVQGSSTVTFNGTPATATEWSATSITVTVPEGAETGNVVVTVNGVASNGVSFTVGSNPMVISLKPAVAQVETTVVIGGANFGSSQGTSTVTFNGAAAAVASWSATSITVTVPADARTGPVVVTVGGDASNQVIFTVTGPAPEIRRLKPEEGEVGDSVRIKGEYFGTAQGRSTVTFNGLEASARKWNDGKIVASVPAGALTGPVVVTVEGQASNPVTFTVTGSSPSIQSLDPASGEAGTPVTITGVHFGAAKGTSTVTFNGVAATPTSWSDTSITVPVPAAAATGRVYVTVGGQASNGETFTVTLPAPSITALDPTEGRGGTSVTISGENFGATRGSSTVSFNGVAVETYTSWNDGSITAAAPSGATTGNVLVTVGGQVSNGVVFTVDETRPGVTVSEAAVEVDEGKTGTYEVKLDTEPGAAVTVTPVSSDAAVATQSPPALTFTTLNWSTAQTVTVTGAEDDDGVDGTATITHEAASTDSDYNGITIGSVAVSVIDNDPVGVTVSPAALEVDEGGTGTYEVKLDTEPGAAVTVTPASSDPAAATLSPAALTFTAANWNVAQTVTVTGAEDDDPDNETATITHEAASTDSDYNGITIGSVAVSVIDNDPVGVTVSPAALEVDEGGTGTYEVKLATEPGAAVTVTPASSDTGVATLSPAALTFTAANWNVAQTVTVTGAEDDDPDNETATITHTAASTDTNYDGITIGSVAVSIIDNDPVGVTVSQVVLEVDEGGTGTYEVKLNTEPGAEVTVTPASSDTDKVTVSPATLTFTTSDWGTAQTVTVTGVEDDDPDNETATITHTAASTDSDYAGITIGSVAVSIIDNDPVGVTVSQVVLEVDEGGTGTYEVKLNTEPGAEVTVTPASSDTDKVTVSPAALTFTTSDWGTAQTVTVTGIEDDDPDNETATITHTAASTDSDYAGITIGSVAVSVIDNDPVGVTVSRATLEVDEGGTGTYEVKLNTEPGAEVTVTPASSDTDKVTVSPAALTFTPSNWSTFKTVTVTGAEDDDGVDGTATITHTATSTDTDYNGISPIGSVAVTVDDDDPRRIVLDKTSLTVNEGRTGSFRAKLNTEPRGGDVTVSCSVNSADSGEISISPGSHDFNTGNWDSYKSFTVTGLQDDDGSDETAGITCSASGGDYGSVGDRSVTVTVRDDDERRIVLDKTSLTVNEGRTGNFRAKLNTEPRGGDVTVSCSVNSADSGEISISPGSHDFNTGNWDSYKSFTVTGLQDDDGSDETAGITCSASGGDYGSVGDRSVTVTVRDDDERRIVLDKTSLTVNEGGTGSFRAKLNTEPSGPVNVDCTVDRDGSGEISISPGSHDFNTGNWDSYKSFTVTGLQDDDGSDETAGITCSASGGDYGSVGDRSVTVTVRDDDERRIVLDKTSLTVNEGGTGSFSAKLSTRPTGKVTVSCSVNNSDSSEVSLSPPSRMFTEDSWNIYQYFTVTGLHDDDGANETAGITCSASGGDYGSVGDRSVTVTVRDDDERRIVLDETSLTVLEHRTGSFRAKLNTEPSGPVNVDCTVDGDDSGEISVSPGRRTFNRSGRNKWSSYQTFTVEGLPDDDGVDETAGIICSASGEDYGSVDNRTVTVTVDDNDTPSIVLDDTDLTINEGGTGTFRVRLNTEPTTEVTVTCTVKSDDRGEISLSPGSRDFSASGSNKWNVYQPFTVTGVQDDDARDEYDARITCGAEAAGEGEYDKVPKRTISVAVNDDEDAEVVVSPSSLTITEGNDGTYNVKLSSEPADSVTITFSVSGSSTVTVPTSSRTFTTSNWNTNQSVTVRTAEDDSDYSNESATVTNTATSSDRQYSGETETVSVSVTDDDTETPSDPSITSINPPLQPPDTEVTITGSNFGSTQGSVSFGSDSVTSISSWSNSSIRCFIPAFASAGTVGVTVTTSDGRDNSEDPYDYTITGQSPYRGDCGEEEDCPGEEKPKKGGSGEGSSEESEDPPGDGG